MKKASHPLRNARPEERAMPSPGTIAYFSMEIGLSEERRPTLADSAQSARQSAVVYR